MLVKCVMIATVLRFSAAKGDSFAGLVHSLAGCYRDQRAGSSFAAEFRPLDSSNSFRC